MEARLSAIFLCAALLCASSLPAAARQRAQGSVEGTVTDAAGAALAGARVYLMDARQALVAAGEAGADGRFRLEGVAPGTYVLRVARKEFAARRVPVEVAAGRPTSLAVALEVEALAERVTVTAEAGQAVDARATAQPINVIPEGRILERAPEVVAQAVDEEPGVSLQRTSPSLSAVFVRGLTGRNVAVYVDGVRYTTSAQRGGVGTFFSLVEPSSLEAIEILRGPNSSQYGSDVLGGVVNFVSQAPAYGNAGGEWHGHSNVFYTSPTNGFGGNALVTHGARKRGALVNLNARRINRLRPGRGLDTHAAVTRFLGIPSDVLGERLPDTAFTQYGGLLRTSFGLDDTTQLQLSYARSQQDGGRRYDQLAGGDGNLVADLRNIMSDLFYARLVKQGLGFFDDAQFTFSYNGQREERVNQGGQGNPFGAVTNQRERTNVLGFNFYVGKRLGDSNALTLGSDVYRDRINAPAFTTDPSTGLATPSRPRVPNGARYLSYGFFAQDVLTAVPGRLRLSGALRYSVSSYRARASDAPVVGGRPLFPDDSERFGALSGRVGAVVTVGRGFDIAAKYARGFRAPNATDLGILGLVGTGFEVNTATAAALGGLVGTTAGPDAVSSGIPVTRLVPEKSDSFDLSLRYTRPRVRAELTGFTNKLSDVYFDQALVLPPGATGLFLGGEQIVRQTASGLVFVAAATSPVLVRVNYDDARFNGVEFDSEARLSRDFSGRGNFTYIRAHSLPGGLPPNIEGGVPPAAGFLSLRYQPRGTSRFYVEPYAVLAGRQNRLSSLDLADRRTGAARSRAQIQNFFRRGACVRGLTTPGTTGQCGSAGGILIPTGETLAQVQNRLLPLGANINGVTVAGPDTAVPLFDHVPGYGLVGVRGALRFGERSEVFFDFENVGDRQYRGISWGVDGAGRGITLRYRYKF
ncbi:MAG TPA: TonB-dependent receptor [Pyrinomonadaceae bacterium]|jgi:outer membrane receptor protein involved in Fe transport